MSSQTRLTLVALIASLLGCGVLAYGLRGEPRLQESSDPGFAERQIAGLKLPDDAGDIHIFKFMPDPDYLHYWVYIKFTSSKERYIQLMKSMGIRLYDQYSLASWRFFPQEHKPAWWDLGSGIADDTAAGDFDQHGHLIGRYEHSYVYIAAEYWVQP